MLGGPAHKGTLETVAADVATQGIREFGIAGTIIIETDSEDATNALRRRVQALHPGEALEQTPAARAHESNGLTENGNKFGKGILRVRLLALEARADGRIPCSHPASRAVD